MLPARAALPQYRMLQKRIETTRVAIVTPRNYGVDNRATLNAIAQLGLTSEAWPYSILPSTTRS